MAGIEKLSLTCPSCGKVFQCKAPLAPGKYSVPCTGCQNKVSFRYQADASQQPPKQEVKLGLLDDGSYRFICKNESCRQSVLVPAIGVKIGHNALKCPRCQTINGFDVEPTEQDMLKCQTADCDGILVKPDAGDGIYSYVCDKCGQEYSLMIQNGKVAKVTKKTMPHMNLKKQWPMKLVSGQLLGKKEYVLSKGMHYVGRMDNCNPSDFEIKDKYASCRSVRIDVNENGGTLVYRLTVERATNPVYHNNRELTVGDIIYLTYGDTLKLGKTLIKVQKVQS